MCTMFVLSNQYVKVKKLAELAVWSYPYNTTKAVCLIGTCPHPPLSQTHHQFCAEDVAGPWKADSVWCYACQTFCGQ